MFGRLLALFLITPVVELALLLQLGDLIGVLPTIGLIVVTGLTGTYLAKREGLSVWRRFNQRLQRGELPGTELIDGMIILVAGALLITPGVLTDITGFVGLIPITRRYLRQYFNRRIQEAVERGSVRLTFGGLWKSPPEGRPSDERRAVDEAWRGRQKDIPRYGEDERA